MRASIALVSTLLATFAATATAQTPPPPDSDQIVTNRHQITVAGQTLRYTARAGLLPIRDNEAGDVHGRIFFVAYTLDRAPGQPPRPLTFVWNGGPGSPAVLLHFVGFGPKRIKTSDDPTKPLACDCELEDNQATLLDQTDLVFVDPVGTGFSRPTKGEYGAEFYQTLGDIASVAEFIRVYRTRFDAWDAPLYLLGESFGVWRAAGVAEALERRQQKVAGVVLISGGIPVGPVLSEEMRAALFIPTRAASALYHKRLAPELQRDPEGTLREVERWAKTEYAPALAKRDSLTDQQRQAIAAQLARFTGLDPSLVDKQALAVGRQQFADNLLKDQHRVLARFDTRQTTTAPSPPGRSDLVNRYLRDTLRFKTDLVYVGLGDEGFSASGGVRPIGSRWNYNQNQAAATALGAAGRGGAGGGGAGGRGAGAPSVRPPADDAPPGGAEPWLRRAIAIDPSLKVYVAAGLYDSLNSCAANEYLVGQLEPALARNITAACYEGGHMMYEGKDTRMRLKRDLAKFYEAGRREQGEGRR